ncbi:MAG TPA: glycosyltransferase [Thermoanaerobaculia bacterium]|nr:glycosyltransferase [Thermoanaerobaculia bacterium]
MDVTVVIPARNAAETLAETLDSVLSQSFGGWEAVVVDDGSTDATAEVADAFARRDPRVRLVRQPPLGVGMARNTGLAEARSDWLLFLDADDWLCPRHLERMTAILAAEEASGSEGIGGAYCGWRRVAPGGLPGPALHAPADDDLFHVLARGCAFAIHACVVRRGLVEAVGGFDAGLVTCEEWDLWQKVARTGARFLRVPEVLALYRMRAGSASLDPHRLLADGLRVIGRGHAPDPRVPSAAAHYIEGVSRQNLPAARLLFLCWCAGLAIGRGDDPLPLLASVPMTAGLPDPPLDPTAAARSLFLTTVLPRGLPPESWLDLWPEVEGSLGALLALLGRRTSTPAFARRTRRVLERLILEHAPAPTAGGTTLGSTRVEPVEITEPFQDITVPISVDRLHARVLLEGEPLGSLELPVCDRVVPAAVLADAVAAEYAWQILGRFIERTTQRPEPAPLISPSPLTAWQQARRRTAVRGAGEEARPASAPAASGENGSRGDFDRTGWTSFLQEIWGRPGWPVSHFYDPQAVREDDEPRRRAERGWIVVEVAGELPRVEIPHGETLEELRVVLRVGGVETGIVPVAVRGEISAHELRVALTEAAGFELCRAAVREALLGVPLGRPGNLRERLAAASARHRRETPSSAGPPEAWPLAGSEPAPGWQQTLTRAVGPEGRGAVLARHASVRRAALPSAALLDLEESAAVAGEPLLRVEGTASTPGPPRIVYAPDLLWVPHPPAPSRASPGKGEDGERVDREGVPYGRSHFEALFASGQDPWRYTSAYEATKYDQTLDLLDGLTGSGPIPRALELACAEGHFTVRLAPRVGHLVAVDISRIALERAAQRCQGLDNVELHALDLFRDPLPGPFPLIVCSEVLYYAGGLEDLARTASSLAGALEPGGHLLTAHANLIVDEPDRPGFDWDHHPFGAKTISDALEAAGLHRIRELRTPLYRVQLFRRPRGLLSVLPPRVQLTETDELPPLPPKVAERARLQGGTLLSRQVNEAAGVLPGVVTYRLPILMYHRVASGGGAGDPARWRVSPEAFEEQLRYLRDSGYHTPRLEDWRRAAESKRPLAGRAVLLTFDDGYRDFAEHAWPLLRRYGFSALVFLVAGAVGSTNRWDAGYGHGLPLLGWDEVRRLRAEGVELGSHSGTHRPLTSLAATEVVREAAHSRAVIARALGEPPRAFAYPYGDTDPAVRHLVSACGYVYGLTTRPGRCGFGDGMLDLPRIEVAGDAPFERFVARLEEVS